jgi:hypothetical protein
VLLTSRYRLILAPIAGHVLEAEREFSKPTDRLSCFAIVTRIEITAFLKMPQELRLGETAIADTAPLNRLSRAGQLIGTFFRSSGVTARARELWL